MKDDTRFGCEINKKILEYWKDTITKNESIKERIEESLKDNTKKHKELLIKKLNEEK